MVLAVVAGSSFSPTRGIGLYGAKNDAERAGLTNMGFNIGIRRLLAKNFIEMIELFDENNGEPYEGVRVIDSGWTWIDANETRFVLYRPSRENIPDGIPF